MLTKKALKEIGMNFSISVIALFLALCVGSVVMLGFGYSPIAVYGALLNGAFGTPMAFTMSITKAVPLIFTGLAVALAFKCTVFNIGVEGQLLVGAMAAAIVGAYVQLPIVIHIPLTLLCSMAAGMLWSFFPAILKYQRNVHVVISTIMFNYIGQYLVQYLVLGPFASTGDAANTKPIYATAVLPKILPSPYVLNLGIIIAILFIFIIYILLNKTTMGYEMRAVGLNKSAALTNGISVDRNMFLAMLISGALAGLAGGVEVTGSLGKIVNNFSPGYGFNGIPVALIARNNPFAIFFSALLIGAMRNGSLMMQSSVGISKNMVDIIQGLVIVFLCAENVIRYYIKKVMAKGGRQHA